MSNKRNLEEAELDDVSNAAKKRKLNTEESSPLSTVPLSSATTSTATKTNSTSPKTNKQETNDKEETNDNDDDEDSSKNKESNSNDDKIDNGAKSKSKDDDNKKQCKSNETVNDWSFKATAFTFGDNSWVKQTSDLSNNSQKSNGDDKEVVNDDNTTNSFSQFEGLGFEKVLNETSNDGHKNKKTEENEKDTKKTDNETSNGWASGWSNSNPDGTFKLNFDWGSWKDTKIDLNPSSKIGYGTQAPVYDPNNFETEEPEAVLTGEIDAGDQSDEIQFTAKCKVYTLDGKKYNEKGVGNVNINTYKITDNDSKQIKARILCRRDQVLSTIINAPIHKDMKFEKVSSYIRFAVVEKIEKKESEQNNDDNDNDNDNTKTEEEETNKEKEEESEKEKEKEKEDNDNKTEDKDIATKCQIYLIKPIGDKSQIDTMIQKIKKIQEDIN